jgi:hypothetical protein
MLIDIESLHKPHSLTHTHHILRAAAAMVSLAIYMHSSFPPPPGTPPSIGSPIKPPPSPMDASKDNGSENGAISFRKKKAKKMD